MKVISTNIGQKEIVKWRGNKVETGIFKYPVNQPIYLGLTDVINDSVVDRRYHGGEDKACYLYSAGHYEFWKQKLPKANWQWGMFGENLTIDELNESEIHIGDIYRLGEALVQVSQPRQPCFKLGIRLNRATAVKMFVAAEKPGAYIRVLEPGFVKVGDALQLVKKMDENFTLQQVFHLVYHAATNVNEVKQAIAMPELAESCRRDLIKFTKL